MEPFIGEIRLFAGNYAPENWALCDGQVISISQHPELFALLGTVYGGDGVNTFALPDLRGRIPLHKGTNPATGSTYALGQAGGTETVTLTTQQLPSHSHQAHAVSAAGTQGSPENALWAASSIAEFSTQAPNTPMAPNAVGVSGGSQPHENLMPFTCISFIISLYGVWPSQS